MSALRKDQFAELFAMDDTALAERGARRYVVDAKPGFPCRVSLEDAEPGERVVLVPYTHLAEDTPYRATGPIFVREAAVDRTLPRDTVPGLLRLRLLSLRAYTSAHTMVDADVVDGQEVERGLARLFARAEVSYVHVHYAKPGCYACRVDRA